MKKPAKKRAPRTPKTFDPKKLPHIKPTYTVSVKYGEEVHTASSDDLVEAILALKPSKISTRTIFELEHDGRKATVMKPVFRARRILADRPAAFYFARQLLMLLK